MSAAGANSIDTETAKTYGITGTSDQTASLAVQNIINCLAGYCNATSQCSNMGSCKFLYDDSPAQFPTYFVTSTEYYDVNELLEESQGRERLPSQQEEVTGYMVNQSAGMVGCISELCDAVMQAAVVNPDIGGFGVKYQR